MKDSTMQIKSNKEIAIYKAVIDLINEGADVGAMKVIFLGLFSMAGIDGLLSSGTPTYCFFHAALFLSTVPENSKVPAPQERVSSAPSSYSVTIFSSEAPSESGAV